MRTNSGLGWDDAVRALEHELGVDSGGISGRSATEILTTGVTCLALTPCAHRMDASGLCVLCGGFPTASGVEYYRED